MKTALQSVPSSGQTDPPATVPHNESVIPMLAISPSLSPQMRYIEKTIDTQKIQFPLRHIKVHRNFRREILNIVELAVTPPNVLS